MNLACSTPFSVIMRKEVWSKAMSATAILRPKLSKKAERASRKLQAAEDIRLAIGPLTRAAQNYMGDEWFARYVQPLADEMRRLRPSSLAPTEEPSQ